MRGDEETLSQKERNENLGVSFRLPPLAFAMCVYDLPAAVVRWALPWV